MFTVLYQNVENTNENYSNLQVYLLKNRYILIHNSILKIKAIQFRRVIMHVNLYNLFQN